MGSGASLPLHLGEAGDAGKHELQKGACSPIGAPALQPASGCLDQHSAQPGLLKAAARLLAAVKNAMHDAFNCFASPIHKNSSKHAAPTSKLLNFTTEDQKLLLQTWTMLPIFHVPYADSWSLGPANTCASQARGELFCKSCCKTR